MLRYYIEHLWQAVLWTFSGYQSIAGVAAVLIMFLPLFPKAHARALAVLQWATKRWKGAPSEPWQLGLYALATLFLVGLFRVHAVQVADRDVRLERLGTRADSMQLRVDSLKDLALSLQDSLANVALRSRTSDSALRARSVAFGDLRRLHDSTVRLLLDKNDSAYAGLAGAYLTARQLVARPLPHEDPEPVRFDDWVEKYDSLLRSISHVAKLLEPHEATQLLLPLESHGSKTQQAHKMEHVQSLVEVLRVLAEKYSRKVTATPRP